MANVDCLKVWHFLHDAEKKAEGWFALVLHLQALTDCRSSRFRTLVHLAVDHGLVIHIT